MIFNIRLKLIVVTLLAILPAVIFIFYLNFNSKKSAQKHQLETLSSIAGLYSAEHAQVVENARHLLIALSAAPQLKNRETCGEFLNLILKRYQRYSNFGVADKAGNVICSAVPLTRNLNVSENLFFSQTITTQDFSAGEYRISPTTKNAVLSFGYPYQSGIIYSSIDISWLNNITKNISAEENINTLLLDSSGVILTRYPFSAEWIGKNFPPGKLTEAIVSSDEGLVEDRDIDGVKRVYVFQKISDQGPFVVVGMSQDQIFKPIQKDFLSSLLISFIILLASFIFAWWTGTRLIVRQVRALQTIGKLKDDFISLVSHQIRTPLTSIRWLAEIFLGQKSPRKSLIKDIHLAAGRLIELVAVILDIAKIESGKIDLQPEPIETPKMIREVLADLHPAIKKKSVKLKLYIEPNAELIIADQKLIKQVYANLIGNAVKYSKEKGKIEVVILKKKDRWVSRIKDQGIGIPEKETEKIFKKFSRAANAVKQSPNGAGLGLYLVRLIVEAHGGRIWFTSNKKNTTFIFSLPRKKML